LIKRCGLREEKTGVWLRYRQYLDKDGKPEVYQPMPQLMTSWGLLYRAMRAAFPDEYYFKGDTLLSFESSGSHVRGRFARSGEIDGDLLVAADGSRSLIRSALFPDVKPRYAGYLAIPRPHTAASTSKAAANARALGKALAANQLDIDAALQEWEPQQLDLGRRLEIQGRTLGDRSQFAH
jgi:hypothetical protein